MRACSTHRTDSFSIVKWYNPGSTVPANVTLCPYRFMHSFCMIGVRGYHGGVADVARFDSCRIARVTSCTYFAVESKSGWKMRWKS